MPTAREIVDNVLKELFEQLPTMDVQGVTFAPTEPVHGRDMIARIDVGHGRHVFCEITADGRLFSARVIES